MADYAKIKPLIFISHSAKDAKAKKVLGALCATLGRYFEVLLDSKGLRASEDWRRELHTWMGMCNGAVILLSEDAFVRSDWVLREATILGYRREDEEDFVLVPVLLPPVTPSRLRRKKNFKPLALDAIQAVASDTPDAIARKVLAAFARLRGAVQKTALQQVEDAVADILYEQVERSLPDARSRLDEAAAQMGRRVSWKTGSSYSRQFARHLLSSNLEKSTKALVCLARSFRDKRQVSRLLDSYLTPFWVNPDAVPELARTCKLPEGRRAVGVNGAEYPFTSESYVLRASGIIRTWVYAKITATSGFEDGKAVEAAKQMVEQEILSQVKPLVGVLDDNPQPARVERALYRKEGREPFFILVPHGCDERLVEWLRERFKRFSFFFLHGKQVPDAGALEAKHILLLPELASGEEDKVCELLEDARGEIERTK